MLQPYLSDLKVVFKPYIKVDIGSLYIEQLKEAKRSMSDASGKRILFQLNTSAHFGKSHSEIR
jgi:hypothetical protein